MPFLYRDIIGLDVSEFHSSLNDTCLFYVVKDCELLPNLEVVVVPYHDNMAKEVWRSEWEDPLAQLEDYKKLVGKLESSIIQLEAMKAQLTSQLSERVDRELALREKLSKLVEEFLAEIRARKKKQADLCDEVELHDSELLRHDDEQQKNEEEVLHEQNDFSYALSYKLWKSSPHGEFVIECCNIVLSAGLIKALDELIQTHSNLNLCYSRYVYSAKVEDQTSKNFMNLVFKVSYFPLLHHITSSSMIISAEDLYNCQVDHDVDYNEMEQTGNMAS